MMAPNPHWFALPATVYWYKMPFYSRLLMSAALSMISLNQLIWARSLADFLINLVLYLVLVAFAYWMVPIVMPWLANRRLELRASFITERNGREIGLHEDLREIASIKPEMNRSGTKVLCTVVTFNSGSRLKIWPHIVQYDELIGRLRTYLDEDTLA